MDLLEMAVKKANDGDKNEYRYVPGRSIACFFYLDNGEHSLYRLHPHVNQWQLERAYLPKNCTKVLGSSMGILLCYPYEVINPFVKNSGVRVPTPYNVRSHPDDPHALVAYVDDYRGLVYHVVCAVSVGHRLPNRYIFISYASHTNGWRYGLKPEKLGDVLVNTGMSCRGRAYWITKRPLPAVVYYDVSIHSHGFLSMPEKFQVDPCPYQLQLGSRGGNHLILLAAMATEMEVYTLPHGEQQWELSFHQEFRNRRPPIPIRSQSLLLQALFWVDNRILVWENRCNEGDRMGQPQHPRMRSLRFSETQPDAIVDFVPHVETTLCPLDFHPNARRHG